MNPSITGERALAKTMHACRSARIAPKFLTPYNSAHNDPVKGSQRLALHLEFSPGSNILLDSFKISKSLKNGFSLNNLSEEKREVLKGIFPKKLFKGYDIKGDSISPNKFKGI